MRIGTTLSMRKKHGPSAAPRPGLSDLGSSWAATPASASTSPLRCGRPNPGHVAALAGKQLARDRRFEQRPELARGCNGGARLHVEEYIHAFRGRDACVANEHAIPGRDRAVTELDETRADLDRAGVEDLAAEI